ncbi:MAG: hypothetical protein E6R11_01170 [Rhodocyclaceae bacterium]|nr:MAG: hypothetical protein E6R11_01170 [Rhodocyclaceae bacterium]
MTCLPSAAPSSAVWPGGCRRALSEAPQGPSCAAAPDRRAAQGTRSAAKGAAAGSPFLWLLSFGEAKESNLPPGNPRRSARCNTGV